MDSTRQAWAERLFALRTRESTARTEVLAGATTFLVASYIIFVNAAILSFAGAPDLAPRGVPFGGVVAATCLVTAVTTLAYGLWANYPFLIAPGMGLNAVVAFQLIAGKGLAWQEAMAVVFLEGLLILLLVLAGVRQTVMAIVPLFLKKAIGVGIGLFLLLIGLVNGGLVKMSGTAAAPLTLGDYTTLPVLVTFVGLLVTITLVVRRVKGALLGGILLTTLVAILLNLLAGGTAFTTPGMAVLPTRLVSAPEFTTLGAPFAQVDGVPALVGLWSKLGLLAGVLTVFSLLLSDFFDTMGTVVGIGSEAGFLDEDGHYRERDLRRILVVDSLGALVGGWAGCSSATTYIESAAGVAEGGRTGLAAVVCAVLFGLGMFLSPLVAVVPPQATAPALILVGLYMCAMLGDIDWRNPDEALPALATITMMPFSYSITNGIGAGFLLHGLVKLLKGQVHDVHALLWAVNLAFVVYFALPSLALLKG